MRHYIKYQKNMITKKYRILIIDVPLDDKSFPIYKTCIRGIERINTSNFSTPIKAELTKDEFKLIIQAMNDLKNKWSCARVIRF